jgi:hypothetical protein
MPNLIISHNHKGKLIIYLEKYVKKLEIYASNGHAQILEKNKHNTHANKSRRNYDLHKSAYKKKNNSNTIFASRMNAD